MAPMAASLTSLVLRRLTRDADGAGLTQHTIVKLALPIYSRFLRVKELDKHTCLATRRLCQINNCQAAWHPLGCQFVGELLAFSIVRLTNPRACFRAEYLLA